MPENIQAPEEASAETQEILKELEAEGNDIAGKEPPVEEPKVEEVKVEEPDPEPKVEEKPNREAKFVPVGKHNEERHKRQEAEAEAKAAKEEADRLRAELAKGKPSESNDIQEAALKLAEKHGVDVDFAREFAETIVGLSQKRNVLPKEVTEALEIAKQRTAEAEAIVLKNAQETGFEKEFAGIVKDFPDLASQKEAIKQLAFSEGKETIPLRYVALEYLHENPSTPGRKTVEAPVKAGESRGVEITDFENLTEEQFAKMSYEEMEKYEAWVDKTKRGK